MEYPGFSLIVHLVQVLSSGLQYPAYCFCGYLWEQTLPTARNVERSYLAFSGFLSWVERSPLPTRKVVTTRTSWSGSILCTTELGWRREPSRSSACGVLAVAEVTGCSA